MMFFFSGNTTSDCALWNCAALTSVQKKAGYESSVSMISFTLHALFSFRFGKTKDDGSGFGRDPYSLAPWRRITTDCQTRHTARLSAKSVLKLFSFPSIIMLPLVSSGFDRSTPSSIFCSQKTSYWFFPGHSEFSFTNFIAGIQPVLFCRSVNGMTWLCSQLAWKFMAQQ